MIPIYEGEAFTISTAVPQNNQEPVGYIYYRPDGGFDLKIHKEWVRALSQEGGIEEA